MKSVCSSVSTVSETIEKAATLPPTGFVRLPLILKVFPVSKSTWWKNVKEGSYPAGVKLSEKCTAWRVEDIRELIKSVGV